jgi:hypothetical protein
LSAERKSVREDEKRALQTDLAQSVLKFERRNLTIRGMAEAAIRQMHENEEQK